MKSVKTMYLVIGFMAGVAYLAACGSTASSIAETIGSAIDVIYDNSSSGLDATNVQAAIDELEERIAALEVGSDSAGGGTDDEGDGSAGGGS